MHCSSCKLEAVHYCISLSNIIKICTHAPARYQELDITLNFALVGFGFEALPRCCPFLKDLASAGNSITDWLLPTTSASPYGMMCGACMAVKVDTAVEHCIIADGV
jgi:hypothetical protein